MCDNVSFVPVFYQAFKLNTYTGIHRRRTMLRTYSEWITVRKREKLWLYSQSCIVCAIAYYGTASYGVAWCGAACHSFGISFLDALPVQLLTNVFAIHSVHLNCEIEPELQKLLRTLLSPIVYYVMPPSSLPPYPLSLSFDVFTSSTDAFLFCVSTMGIGFKTCTNLNLRNKDRSKDGPTGCEFLHECK